MRSMKLLAGALAGMCFVSASSVSLFASAEQSDNSISAVIEMVLGDPSGDGIINAVDASYILETYSDYSINLGELTDEILAVCDVNKDGAVNAMDASYVLSYYANKSDIGADVTLENYIKLFTDFINQTDLFDWQPDWEKYLNSSLDPASSVQPGYQIDPNFDWSTWDPASSIQPGYQVDPSYDWSSWLPEGFFDEESPWTWPPTDSDNPWSSLNDPENWGSWYDQPLQEIDGSWFEETLNALKEIEDTTNENE